MPEKFTLQLSKQVLSELNDAVLFVDKDGAIIWGNRVAYDLLNIDKNCQKLFINDYFELDLLKKKPRVTLLMQQKNKSKLLIKVKFIQLENNLDCLILEKVG